ncbi:hypothetical protein, partial [Thioalkalivibrio sp.]|uniref:hypothetical protein n=1 Tax=Thioalkalivibrio sp. TaxID=2093813 RepID=UPI003975548F
MTKDEWIEDYAYDKEEAKRIKQGKVVGASKIKAQHEVAVRDAIEQGENVPEAVLKEYPDLAKEAPKEVPKMGTEELPGRVTTVPT